MPTIDKLGKYEIRREIARGAMGVVYEGYDPMIKRAVAIKTIRADQLAGEDAGVVLARFRREAQAVGRLAHPNIVPIYDFDEDDGTSFIAMEYVEGRELKDYFAANERFAMADVVRIMSQILDALAYSHARGVVHRDVKPANVFITADGSVKVADFGIAHVDSSSMTQSGSVMGTPGYMSPEQILGMPVDGRSDLFSAGVILYQFLTGERPFSGSTTTTMQKVLKEDPLPPSTLNVQLPESIDAIVRMALAKRPEERYQTAAEFAAALREAMGPRATGAALPTPPRAGAYSDTQATMLNAPTLAASTREATMPDAQATVLNVPPAMMPAGAGQGRSAQPPSPAYGASPAPSARPSQTAAIAIVLSIAFLAVAAGALLFYQFGYRGAQPAAGAAAGTTGAPAATDASAKATPTAVASPAAVQSPAESQAALAAAVAPAITGPAHGANVAGTRGEAREPGMLMISAVGLADPGHPRYQGNASLLQGDARADAKSQLVEKALGLVIERASLANNYALLSDRVLAKSASFIGPVVRESEPRMGKDGLMSVTTEAIVNVKAVQKSVNDMTRTERIDLIRASGDPRIAMQVSVRDADQAGAAGHRSPVAENLLKERVKSFGFRTWASERADPSTPVDFVVTGDASIRKLSMRLEASGITVTKYALTSLTVKCVDRATGEEIYFNTVVPKGAGSFASQEEALKVVGGRIAEAFSRDFFLQHVTATGERVALSIDGLPQGAAELVGRELVGLPAVIGVRPAGAGKSGAWNLEVSGAGSPADRIANEVLAPLNAKLGQACFALGASNGNEVSVRFDAGCSDSAVLSRLETHPPAGLYGAPAPRQKALIQNPEMLRKLAI